MKPMEQDCDVNMTDEYFLKGLASEIPDERLKAAKNIKNTIIGMKTRKTQYINAGLIEKLVDLMMDETVSIDFAIEGAAIFGSLAKGADPGDMSRVIDHQVISLLCKGVLSNDERLSMTCLRSLRICFKPSKVPVPSDLIFEDANLISTLVQMLSKNSQTAEYVTSILARSLKLSREREQSMLYEAGAIPSLIIWLEHKQAAVLRPVLSCLSFMAAKNEIVAEGLYKDIHQQLLKLMSQSKSDYVQLDAAVCLTMIIRAIPNIDTPNIDSIKLKLVSVFVRMCQPEKPADIKDKAGGLLTYLIERDNELQETAAISNHLIKNISLYFVDSTEKKVMVKLRKSGFRLYACLSANSEKIRKEIVDSTPNLINFIHEAINQDADVKLQAAALQCLLSLSRSVQQLRTTFKDVKLWEPVISALKSSQSDDIISVASSVLCNLLLVFSPCKEMLMDYGALEVLIALMQRKEAPLRVNGAWGVMNLAYDANDRLKNTIVDAVGMQNILNLISDEHVEVAVKALGILRNLLTEKELDIDSVMQRYGNEIMTAVRPFALNDDLEEQLKEQVLCLLSNIAIGNYAKTLLITEEPLLRKLIGYMSSKSEKLQVASVFCITNLTKNHDDAASSNHCSVLKELGVISQLNALLTTSNPNLLERVKAAISKF